MKRPGGSRVFVLAAVLVGATAAAAPHAPPSDPVVSVALGDEHGCALTRAGLVRCWGRNFSGQLGDGTRTDRARPVALSGLDQVAQLAASGARSCAVRRDGSVSCWGQVAGLLGDGTAPVFGKSDPQAWDRVTPAQVSGIAGVTQIALGGEHLCALTQKGVVFCWGGNAEGQLGDGTQMARDRPTKVPGLDRVTQIALGVTHSCALRDDGNVLCWGSNEGGQLADRTLVRRTQPTRILEFGAVAQLAASNSSTCARLVNGTARCWGWNARGQLGDGTTQNHPIPVAVHGLDRIREIALGARHGCALLANGAVSCWGDNSHGQLADRELERSMVPLVVATRGMVAALASPGQFEGGHSCAVLTAGEIVCWGRNDHGQLGRGRVEERGLPALVDW